MASFIYGPSAEKIIEQSLDLLVDTIKAGLSNSTHVPDKDDEFLDNGGADDFIDGELSGTGYVAGFGNSGRQALGSKTVVYDTANDRVEFDAADVTWSGIDAGTIEHVTLLKEITNDAASPIIAEIDVATQATNGGDIVVQWNAEGIIQFAV